jgi:pyruvate ferredoxin oxidoreductase gamma subunit
VFQGLKPEGYVLVNSNKSVEELGLGALVCWQAASRVRIVPATELAMKHIGRPLPNAVLLGAFAALTGIVHLASMATAIREAFPSRIAEANVAAATDAYNAINAVKAAA